MAHRNATSLTPLVGVVGIVLALGCGGLSGGPWAGDHTFVATLTSEDAPPTDLDVLRGRLERLAIDHDLEGTPARVGLTVRNVRGPELFGVLTRPMKLRIGTEGDARVVSNADVASASVVVDDVSGRVVVQLQFTESGAATFCALTKDHIGEALDLHVDGHGTEPVVRDAICGGVARIEGGDLEEAAILAVAVQGPALKGTWTLVSVDEQP